MAWLAITLDVVPQNTDTLVDALLETGAVSVEGTLAGVIAAAGLSAVGAGLGLIPVGAIAVGSGVPGAVGALGLWAICEAL